MKTGEEYLEEVRNFDSVIYFRGDRIQNVERHPVIKPVINTARATYDLALRQENSEYMLSTSPLTGEKCNLLNNLFSTRQDLIKSVKLRRWWQNQVGSCNAGRCAGTCVANSIYHSTYMVDQRYHTDYHQRFKEFFKQVQRNDQICAAGAMCVKGDRSMGPLEQTDPDLYLRVVNKDSKGIVVRGAKAHQSNGALAHEILVIPFRAFGEQEKDYVISFAVNNGAKGLYHIWQYNLHDSRRMTATDWDLGNKNYGLEYHGTCLSVFDNVFVPWERVFLCGEYEFSALFAEKFADLIRMCGGGCRPGAVDLAIGSMALLAEYNGLDKANHILEKLTNLSHLSETGYGCALAAAHEGEFLESGLCFPDSLLANCAKLNGSYAFTEAHKWIGDIAGGIIATCPSERDFKNSEVGHLLQKYFQGKGKIPTEDRIKAIRFAEMLGAGPPLHGLICGGGTPETQKMVVRKKLNLDVKKELVKKLW